MIPFALRLLRLIWGLFLYALGIVITLKAHIGYAPWDVLHAGLAGTLGGSTIGAASIATGLLVIAIAVLLGERVGLGTLLNMLLIGVFMDAILETGILPQASGYAPGAAMMLAGLFVIAFGSYFYIGSAFGAGPRDSLMVALTRKTKLPVGAVRAGIELAAALVGWRLGGLLGIGTVLSAFAVGFCVQVVFRLLRFDPTKVVHEALGRSLERFVVGPERKA